MPTATRLLPLLLVCAVLAAADAHRRPNILVLVTDDQRADCAGYAGHPLLTTPSLDALAAGGTVFSNAFVTTSICCISRASLVSGRYARNHRVLDFATPLAPRVLATSFPLLLRRAGWRTGCFGKWGIAGKGQQPEQEFDTWEAWGDQGQFFRRDGKEQVHDSELLARRAEAFIRADRARPFCALVLYKAPHEPYQCDPRDAKLFAGTPMPPAASATPEDFARLPAFLQTSEGRTRAQRDFPTPERLQEFTRAYLRCIAGVDRSVGRLMALLDTLGIAQDTVVVFTSDNGFLLGEHGLNHKWFMFEESIRVPLIVRDPRRPPGKRAEMALNVDIAPTLLEIAGVPVPREMDGRSLAPLLGAGASPADWRTDFLYEHDYVHGGRIPRTHGLRTAEWKYVVYPDQQPAVEQLFDLANDQLERRDLAGDAAQAGRLATMRERFRQAGDALTRPR